MDTFSSTPGRKNFFREVERFFGDLDAITAARIVECAVDLALVIKDGVIVDVAVSDEELRSETLAEKWIGERWVDTVTADSRSKIDALLGAPTSEAGGRPRQVNHPSHSAPDVPITYTTVRAGNTDRIIALGRDLRPLSALQQRLIQAHQELERDYTRLRDAEARYQSLFEAVAEPILIVRAESLEIENVNPSAARLLGERKSKLIGKSISTIFNIDGLRLFERLSAHALTGEHARAEQISLPGDTTAGLSLSAFGRGDRMRFILRFIPETQAEAGGDHETVFRDTLDSLPDALIMTDADLRIVAANRTFLDLAHLSGPGQARGAALSDYVGRSATDLNVLMSSLRENGAVRNFATIIRDRFGNEEPVELSAVASKIGERRAFGFAIRNISRRLPATSNITDQLPGSVEQLTEMVGRVPLKDIVGDATLLIEKLCIEAALNLTDDNRASAAELLGLSRQGLYSKLKRFGMEEKG